VQGLQAALLSLLEDIQANSTDVIVIAPGIELQVAELVTEVGTSLRELITGIAVKSPTILLGASKTLLMTIITLFISFYMTADSKKIVAWLHFIAPPGYRADVQMLLSEINGIWSDFFRGQVLVAIVAAILNTIIAFAIGLPEPLLMGLLAGVLEFLVSVGHTIWLIIALVLALTQGSTYLPVSPLVFALIVIGTNLLFTKLDLNFVIPRIVGERMHLHPMVVLIGIVVGASVGGVLGIALAAPAIASLRVLGRYIRAKLFDLDPYSEMREVAPVPDAARARRGRRKAEESPPAPSEAK
jgi:predicted PurR-regulated permease PerM